MPPAAPTSNLLDRLHMGGGVLRSPLREPSIQPPPSHPTVPPGKGTRLPYDRKHLPTKGAAHLSSQT